MLLRYAILGLLEGQELHGYRIKSAFEEQVGGLWRLNFGQIYQTLKDLRRRGLIDGRFDRGTGHVGRWVYTITAKGRRALDTWLHRSPRPPEPVRDEIVIRLLALESENTTARLEQIAAQERVYREYVTNVRAQRDAFHRRDKDEQFLGALTADATIFRAEAHLRWLAHCRKILTERIGTDSADAPLSTEKPLVASKTRKAARA